MVEAQQNENSVVKKPVTRYKDPAGIRYGSVVGVKLVGKDSRGGCIWLLRCDCGNEFERSPNTFVRSGVWYCRDCGKQIIASSRTSHGMYRTPEHNSWQGIKTGCLNENNPAYSRYGGRGDKNMRRVEGLRRKPLFLLLLVQDVWRRGGHSPCD